MTDTRRPETVSSGNALFAVFGAVALVGLLGASVNSFVRGPLTSAVKQTRTNIAKSQMQIAGQAAVMAAATGTLATEYSRIFVTSTTTGGNIGGLSGADAYCQARASAGGLPGTYKAWLSSSTVSAASRLVHHNVPYRQYNGNLVADNWADLIDGTLSGSVTMTELGTTVYSGFYVWTGSTTNGSSHPNTCTDWTTGSSGVSGSRGLANNTTSSWTANGSSPCNGSGRFYCVQQDTSTTAATNGDCDGDGTVEPLEMRDAGALPAPTGGGLVPTKIGISKKDPWGTEYGYCTWDYGSTVLNSSCQQEAPGTNLRLAGHATNKDAPVVAIISAGPDRKFTTTCRSFAAADVNSNGVLTDSGDLALVGKAAANDDDIIFAYTYTEAMNATGGLWQLKSGAPNTATIAKNVEAQDAKFSGAGLFAQLAAYAGNFLDVVSGIRLGSPAVVPTCDSANTHALRRNASSNAIEVCNGTTWTNAVAFGGTGGDPFAEVPPQTENKVFVTSATYTGDLGGLSGADAICQKHANSAGLPGKYMAWLADASGSPATRFYQSTVPYKLVDGTTVANNWTDLTDGTLAAGINRTEGNAAVTAGANGVWTNTSVNGTSNGGGSCLSWTDKTLDASGVRGVEGNSVSSWTAGPSSLCNAGRRLYCFQQTEAATAGGGGSTAGAFDSFSDALTDYPNWQMFGGPGSGAIGGSGYGNVTWGYQNLTSSSSATQTTAFGTEAAKLFNAGSSIALGANAMANVATGDENTMVGSQAGASLGSNDYYNTGIGYNVFSGTPAIGNTYIGAETGKAGTDNVGFGAEALQNNTGNQNVVMGFQAAMSNTTGSNNTVAGAEALKSNTSGSNNVAIGYQAMNKNRTDQNTAVGQRSLTENVNGLRAVAIGAEASRYQLGDDNTAIGAQALKGASNLSTGINNTAVGFGAIGVNTTGVDNTAVGYMASNANTTGSYNAAVGYQALMANTAGSNNTAIGSEALKALVGAASGVPQTELKIFVTDVDVSGNLGGLSGADATCQSKASAAGLTGTFKAWLADSTNSPDTRFSKGTVPYKLVDGTTIANNWADLTDGTIAAGIIKTQSNANIAARVWTNVASNGTAYGANHCQNWTSNSASYTARTGISSNVTNWTNDSDFGCQNVGRFYCFEQMNSGSDNTAFGSQALKAQTSASGNTAVGYNAGSKVTTSSGHTIIGAQAQENANPAGPTTAIGHYALYDNYGSGNTAIGTYAGLKIIGGSNNTSIGYASGQATGSLKLLTNNMTSIGSTAAADASGNNITAIGYQALSLASGTDNTGVGYQTMTQATTGAYNTAIGHHAGLYMTTASHNTLAGSQAGAFNQTGDFVTAAGFQASLQNLAPANTALGYQALLGNSSGLYNTAIGYVALQANTVGNFNTAVGSEALVALNGTYSAATCTGLGAAATATDTATGHCYYKIATAVTWASARSACQANGDYLAVITSAAEQAIVQSANGGSNSWIGASDSPAGEWRWQTGEMSGLQFWQGDNTGVATNGMYTNWDGSQPSTLSKCVRVSSTNGRWSWNNCGASLGYMCEREPSYASSYNTAIGTGALRNSADGNRNTAVGYQALMRNVTGSDNTAAGYQALYFNQTGSQNTAIGYGAGPLIGNANNTVALGNGAEITASNTIRVGNTSITAITGQVAFSAPSDARLKKDIAPSDLGLDFIMGLKPVSYRLKQGNGRLDYGFLAQDIEEKLDGRITNMITRRNDEMKTYQLRASDLIAPLVKALQEQDAIIQRLQSKIDAIKAARACTTQNAEGRNE